MDIDAVTLLGSEFDKNGKYILWSPYGDISSIRNLEASQELPFPSGRETEIKVNNNKDSFFTLYDDYFLELFEVDTEIRNIDGIDTPVAVEKDGSPVIRLKYPIPKNLKLLARFLQDVELNGLSIKGGLTSNELWKSSPEADAEWDRKWSSLRDLGFNTTEQAYNALTLIKAIVDKHNMYIHDADDLTRQSMTKNQCQWTMYQVCSTPSNLVELMVGVDVSTEPIKDKKTGAVAQSPYNGDDKLAAPGNYNTIFRSFQEGQIGKQCVGIGAVSIKVNSTMQYYMDSVLKNGTGELKRRILFPKVDSWGRRSEKGNNYYTIDGHVCRGMGNLYDKNAEAHGQNFKVTLDDGTVVGFNTSINDPELQKLLHSIQIDDDITPNVAMSLAAMLSVAVDNAKDLALAKINAGPKMFGFYAYGISLGLDIRTLAKIINTPQGRAISKICEGNVLNGQMGAFSALQAIEKLEGKNLFYDLIQYDVPAIELSSGDGKKSKIGIAVEKTSCRTASDLLEVIFNKYYDSNIINDNKLVQQLLKKPNTLVKGRLNDGRTLSNMLYLIGIIGKMDECAEFVKDYLTRNPELQKELNTLENATEWKASAYQLLEHCQKYGNLVNIYYQRDNNHYYARDLKILAQGAEEMRVLGTILSSNKGVKSKIEDGTQFIKTIENAVVDRKKIMGESITDDDYIDFTLFCIDSNYREDAIKKYEAVKHSINILDVISNAPHFLSYVRTCGIPATAFKLGSSKYRAVDLYYDAVVNELDLTKSADKDNAIKGIESAVNYDMLKKWLYNQKMYFMLPAGSKMFVGRSKDEVITTKDQYIALFDQDGNGLATFKCYMEEQIIPNLKSNINYAKNSFVQGLTPFGLTKTGTHAEVIAYTLEGNMLPLTESQEVQLQTYKADFSSMLDNRFPGSEGAAVNTMANYADAFYIYSQYVYGGKKGQRSLLSMFDSNECALVGKFREFEADLDANFNFNFSMGDLLKWCAPNSNIYHPSAEYFYANPLNQYGKKLQKRVKQSKSQESPDGSENGGRNSTIKGKLVDDTPTVLGQNNYLHPEIMDLALGENIYGLGVNTNVIENVDLQEVPIDLENPEETFQITANPETGGYSITSIGNLSGRSNKILNIVADNLESAYRPVYNMHERVYYNTIDTNAVRTLLDEATAKVDKVC